MKHLLAIEWLRCQRNRLNIGIVGSFTLLLLLSAINAGFNAREFRAAAAKPLSTQHSANQAEMHDAPKAGKTEQSSAFSASAASQPVRLPALGGLVLSVRQMDVLSSAIKISTRSRHIDGRTGDQLYNPLLHELGLPDFATVMALLLPLSVIALCYGLVQEDRERGIWRLVCTQTRHPWHLVLAALSVRGLLVLVPALLTSSLAFALDPGASLAAFGYWCLLLFSFTLVWLVLAGLCLLLPVSSGAAAIAMLGSWLVLTFALPATLAWAANQAHPLPSRLQTIISIRHFQEQTNQQRQALVTAWYAANPQAIAPQPLDKLPREISGLPAGLALDNHIRPLLYQFEQTRRLQFAWLEDYAPLSPALALILMADRLTGIDAPRYQAFIEAVNQFEDQWRAYFMTPIMINASWSPEQQANAPKFSFNPALEQAECWRLVLTQLLTAAGLLLVLAGLRNGFSKP